MPANTDSPRVEPSSKVRPRAVTLKDVAVRAGVGPMSVSAVLNETQTSTRVSAVTRQRILQVAEELGYRRNDGAAAARSGRFGNMALVMSTQPNHSYFNMGLFIGIEEELARYDLQLKIVRLSDEQLSDSKFVPQILRKLSCDGLLVDYNVDVPTGLAQLVEKFQIPAVWLHIEQATDTVYVDDEGAAFDATRHLIQLGHRNIVHLTYMSGDHQHDSVRNRRRGYERAMQSARLAPWVECLDPSNLKPDTMLERMTGWFGQEVPPTAMFAYGVECALPAWLAAERLGWPVPAKFSLVATHYEEVWVLGRQLTCWEIPIYDMGHEGVRMLLQKINHPDQLLPSKKLPFHVKIGQTCAAVNK